MKWKLLPLILFWCWFAHAQNDYRFDRFNIQQGLSQTICNTIEQDQKGFLWIGTQDGLNRFDGYNFKVFKPDPFDANSLSDNFVNDIIVDTNNIVWLGTEWGLSIYDQKVDSFIQLSSDPKNELTLSDNEINKLFLDPEGNYWVATENNGINRLSKENNEQKKFQFNRYNQSNSKLDAFTVRDITWYNNQLYIATDNGLFFLDQGTNSFIKVKIAESKVDNLTLHAITVFNNELWVGGNDGIYIFKKINKLVRFVRRIGMKDGLSANRIRTMASIDNKMWVGTFDGLTVIELDVNDTTYTQLFHDPINTLSLSDNSISDICFDGFGSVWITTDRGLNRYDGLKSGFKHFNRQASGLNHNIVWSFVKNNHLSLIGTSSGLNIYNHKTKKFTSYVHDPSDENSCPRGSIMMLYCDSKNRFWVGGSFGGIRLLEFDKEGNPKFTEVRHVEKSQRDLGSFTMLEDDNGNFWIGGRKGLSILDKNLTLIARYTHSATSNNSLSLNVVRSIYQDQQGMIWIGTDGGGINKVDPKEVNKLQFEHFDYNNQNKEGLNNSMVLTTVEDDKGNLWFGTYGGGVNIYHPETGKFTHITENEGLSNNVVYGILKDQQGNMWASTNRGISMINPVDYSIKIFGEKHGLQSEEFNIGAYYLAKDGEMYFGGINGYNAFYPEKIKKNHIPPQLVITKILINNEPLTIGELERTQGNNLVLELDYKHNNIEIEFVGLHYTAPKDNSYKYMLEGVETEWVNAKERRYVSYSNLEFGNYQFKVKAANSDGVWNDQEKIIYLTITPPFWHTWWFRIIGIIGFFGVVIGIYYSRLAIIKAQKRLLEQQVSARTQKVLEQKKKIEKQKDLIEHEKHKAEQLLLNILPEQTAKELIQTGKASPRHYRMVSVLFADFKGFTKIAENMRPKELVEELDGCFNAFDDIMDKFQLEKIKTSGDSYMAAGGVPVRNKTNPIDTILAAIEIQHFMEELQKKKAEEGKPAWELRLGIHTGEVIAGVVGKKKFAYDIWGDTVNTASRMESSGEPGKINISGETYELVKEYFECEYRGKIPAKNKGEVDMYYVKGILPELSKDGLGKETNLRFTELLQFNVYSKLNFNKVRNYLLKKLERDLPENLHYHGVHHTRDVIKSAERIARSEGLDEEHIMLIKTAALFHDAGFLRKYWKNEPQGVELAHEILPKYGYTLQQIEMIEGMILATAIPQNPTNLFEEIICDADLDYLGREDFEPIAHTLFQELHEYGKMKTEAEWDKIQISFLEKHRYFTETNKNTREAAKQAHIEVIKKRVAQA